MKKIIKNIFVLVSCIMISFSVQAAEEPTLNVSGICGLYWSIEGTELRIYGKGDMPAMEQSEYPWYPYRDVITHVLIEDGVTSIAGAAFAREYESLAEVTMSDSVKYIGDEAFEWLPNLEKVSLSTNLVTIGANAFSECVSLPGIDLPESLLNIGENAFELCTSLTEVTIPRNVYYISSGLFSSCERLEEVIFQGPIYKIEKDAFSYCTSLEQIDIPESTQTIGSRAFMGCSSLSHIAIPQTVREIGEGAFSACDKLDNINVNAGNSNYLDLEGVLFDIEMKTLVAYPGARTGAYEVPESVEKIAAYAFYYNKKTDQLSLPNSLLSIDDHAFDSMNSLCEMYLGKKLVTVGENAFSYCYNLTDVYYSGSGKSRKGINIGFGNDVFKDAVWHYAEADSDIILSVASKKAEIGKEFIVGINLADNAGVAFLNFKIDYDHDLLELVGYEDAGLSGWTVGVGEGEKAIWVSESISDYDGEVIKLRFKVRDTARTMPTLITLSEISAFDVENELPVTPESGTITIFHRDPGDTNGDGVLDGRDLIRFKQFFAGYSSVEINMDNADVNGDGKVDGRDAIRIAQYLAGYNVQLL